MTGAPKLGDLQALRVVAAAFCGAEIVTEGTRPSGQAAGVGRELAALRIGLHFRNI